MNKNKHSIKTVIAYLHTHWDREWYREFEEFRIRLIEVVDDVIKKLQNNEIKAFYFDGQTSALEDYLEIKPENKQIVKKFIEEKRIFIGPYFCSTDSFLVDSEALIKNLQLGISCSKEFGCNDYIAYHADTFGHSSYIPQIIKYFQIPHAIFWRGLGERSSEFLFRGLKSVYLIEGYFHDYFSLDIPAEQKAQMLKKTLDRIAKYSSDTLLLPLGADHEALADNIEEQISEVNKCLDDYEIVSGTPFEYLKRVKNNFKENYTGEFRDTKRNFILPGVLSSRIDLKQLNAILQWKLTRTIQPIQALMSAQGKCKNLQKETDYLYKLLLKNHTHDSIYGCGIDNVHRENKLRFSKVSQGSNAIFNTIKRDLFRSEKLSVVNLSDFEFSGALKITTDRRLPEQYKAQLISVKEGFPLLNVYKTDTAPITEDYTTLYDYLVDVNNISPFSAKIIEDKNINCKSHLHITDTLIENEKISLRVENSKIIITDKVRNKTYKDFLTFISRKDDGDSYNFGPVKGDMPVTAEIIESKIKEKGHIRSTLDITLKLNNQKMTLLVLLENQNDYLEFDLRFENKNKNCLLQAELSMPENVEVTVSDDLCGYTKRVWDTEYNIQDFVPAQRGIELKNNTAPLQKCVFAQTIGIITEGLQEYEISRNKLRLTLLRCTGVISNPHNPSRGTPAGPPLPTPDLQMQGDVNARFALVFKDNIRETEKEVQKFYGCTHLIQAELNISTMFSSGNDNLLVSTIKSDRDGNVIVRFVNKSDKDEAVKFTTTIPNTGIFITDAMENITKEYADCSISANSFVTLLIKNQ